MAAETTPFLYFGCTLTHNFRFLYDLELINVFVMFYLTFKFRMVTANTQIKAFFMHLNYNIKNNTCVMEIQRQIRLQGI